MAHQQVRGADRPLKSGSGRMLQCWAERVYLLLQRMKPLGEHHMPLVKMEVQ